MRSKLFKQLLDLSNDDLEEVGRDVLFILGDRLNDEQADIEANDNRRTHALAARAVPRSTFHDDARLVIVDPHCPWGTSEGVIVFTTLRDAGSAGMTVGELKTALAKETPFFKHKLKDHLGWLWTWGDYLTVDGKLYGKVDYEVRPRGGSDAHPHA